MKNIIFWISVVLTSIFWPISFFPANKQGWEPFAMAALILLVDWILYLRGFKYHYFLYLLFPIIHPAYLVFPFISAIFNLRSASKIYFKIAYLIILLFVSVISFKSFYTYSIFTPDPLATDTIIKKISLIPNRNLARIYENKTTIFQDKFKSNIFLSLDLNNYFFAVHPQEIGGSSNISKFPFLAMVPFLFGLYCLWENKNRYQIFATFAAATLSIAFINNQDRFDLLLYLPVSLIIFYGLKKLFYSSNFTRYGLSFVLIYLPISIFEIFRILVYG